MLFFLRMTGKMPISNCDIYRDVTQAQIFDSMSRISLTSENIDILCFFFRVEIRKKWQKLSKKYPTVSEIKKNRRIRTRNMLFISLCIK